MSVSRLASRSRVLAAGWPPLFGLVVRWRCAVFLAVHDNSREFLLRQAPRTALAMVPGCSPGYFRFAVFAFGCLVTCCKQGSWGLVDAYAMPSNLARPRLRVRGPRSARDPGVREDRG